MDDDVARELHSSVLLAQLVQAVADAMQDDLMVRMAQVGLELVPAPVAREEHALIAEQDHGDVEVLDPVVVTRKLRVAQNRIRRHAEALEVRIRGEPAAEAGGGIAGAPPVVQLHRFGGERI